MGTNQNNCWAPQDNCGHQDNCWESQDNRWAIAGHTGIVCFSKCVFPECVFPKCVFPKCIFPKYIFSKYIPQCVFFQSVFIQSVFLQMYLTCVSSKLSKFISSDRSSYSDSGLLYNVRSSSRPLFEISSISANIQGVPKKWCIATFLPPEQ